MPEKENLLKWNKYLEIGRNIHKMTGQVRILEARRALVFAKLLIENEFIPRLPMKDREFYETLLHKIAEYLDEHAEVIQTAVREYFLAEHCKAGLDKFLFTISFGPKKGGVQTGFTCDVGNGTETVRYYIKTHQYGPTVDTLKSVKPLDTKELFHFGIGPEAHFIIPTHGTKRTIYIATKECQLDILSNLTAETVNNNALVQLDLISRILCLRDCADNTSNCGQFGQKAMIVDFRIEKQLGFAKTDILDKFYEGNSEFNYTGLMKVAVQVSNGVKKDIMKKSLQEWKLLENIERTAVEIDGLVQRCGDQIRFENDLQKYAEGLKATVEVLMDA